VAAPIIDGVQRCVEDSSVESRLDFLRRLRRRRQGQGTPEAVAARGRGQRQAASEGWLTRRGAERVRWAVWTRRGRSTAGAASRVRARRAVASSRQGRSGSPGRACGKGRIDEARRCVRDVAVATRRDEAWTRPVGVVKRGRSPAEAWPRRTSARCTRAQRRDGNALRLGLVDIVAWQSGTQEHLLTGGDKARVGQGPLAGLWRQEPRRDEAPAG
jgi:hypothetical protein